MSETVLNGKKNYRGSIRWAKLSFSSGIFKVEKRRPFGNESYRITKIEYAFIDSPKKAEKIWAYHHFMACAQWWRGEIRHPIKEFNIIVDDVLSNAVQYKHGLHYNNSLVDVVNWMFYNNERIAS